MLNFLIQYSLPFSLTTAFVAGFINFKINKINKSQFQYMDLSNKVKKIKKLRGRINEGIKQNNKPFF